MDCNSRIGGAKMFYFKIIENNEVVQIGTHSLIVPDDTIEITEEEYNILLAEFEAKWEAEKPDTDPVIDSIISEVASNGY